MLMSTSLTDSFSFPDHFPLPISVIFWITFQATTFPQILAPGSTPMEYKAAKSCLLRGPDPSHMTFFLKRKSKEKLMFISYINELLSKE